MYKYDDKYTRVFFIIPEFIQTKIVTKAILLFENADVKVLEIMNNGVSLDRTNRTLGMSYV